MHSFQIWDVEHSFTVNIGDTDSGYKLGFANQIYLQNIWKVEPRQKQFFFSFSFIYLSIADNTMLHSFQVYNIVIDRFVSLYIVHTHRKRGHHLSPYKTITVSLTLYLRGLFLGFACFLLSNKVLESQGFSAAVFWCQSLLDLRPLREDQGTAASGFGDHNYCYVLLRSAGPGAAPAPTAPIGLLPWKARARRLFWEQLFRPQQEPISYPLQ